MKIVRRRGAPAASSAPRVAEGARVDDEGVGFGILDLIELVGERAERMQPGDGGAAKVRGNAGAPGLVPIGREKRDAAAAVEPCRDEHRLKAPDQVVRRAIAERAAVPGESSARGIAAERRERLRTDGRAGIERRPHGVPPGIDRTRFLRAAIRPQRRALFVVVLNVSNGSFAAGRHPRPLRTSASPAFAGGCACR